MLVLRVLWVSQGFAEKQREAGPWPGTEMKSPQLSELADLPWQTATCIMHACVRGILPVTISFRVGGVEEPLPAQEWCSCHRLSSSFCLPAFSSSQLPMFCSPQALHLRDSCSILPLILSLPHSLWAWMGTAFCFCPGIEPRALDALGKRCTLELYPESFIQVILRQFLK